MAKCRERGTGLEHSCEFGIGVDPNDPLKREQVRVTLQDEAPWRQDEDGKWLPPKVEIKRDMPRGAFDRMFSVIEGDD